MHAVGFEIKRVYHRSLVYARAFARGFGRGVTPARLDMLSAIFQEHVLIQRQLAHVLGVCEMTVSRMVRSLEKLGLVHREKSEFDARERFVFLTRRGFAVVKEFLTRDVVTGLTALPAIEALHPAFRLPCNACNADLDARTDPARADEPLSCRVATSISDKLERLRWRLSGVRRAWRDFACLDYADVVARRGEDYDDPRSDAELEGEPA